MNNLLIKTVIEESGYGRLVNHEDRTILRNKISELESSLLLENQADVPLRHTFSPGVYAREIFIPKGTLIVGKIHKFENMNIISQGEVSFFSIDGALRVKSPHTFVASPGVKRVIYAHEDTTWTTIHGTKETDLEKIEAEFIAKEYDEVYEATDRSLDSVLRVTGFTHEQLTEISENENDQVPFASDHICLLEVKDSLIHGKGIFANQEIWAGATIATARLNGMRTPAGRYCNHSGEPNAKMVMLENGDVNLVAIKEIEFGSEILTDYYFNYTKTRG